MTYLLLALAVTTITAQDVFKKKYNQRGKDYTFLFTAIVSLFAMLLFVAINRDFYYSPQLLIPSAGFALSYAAATFFTVQAIRCGSLAKTCLVVSFSLLIPCFYGLLKLDEDISVTLVAGILFLILSLVFINYEKGTSQQKTPARWYLFAFLAFLGNGMCSTVQKAKQVQFGDQGNNLFMIAALGMVALIMLILSLCAKSERITDRKELQHVALWAMLCGISNGLTNLLVLLLNSRNVPASMLFPVISSGSLVLSFLYSVLVIREKFSSRQYIGFLIGAISVVLLNL